MCLSGQNMIKIAWGFFILKLYWKNRIFLNIKIMWLQVLSFWRMGRLHYSSVCLGQRIVDKKFLILDLLFFDAVKNVLLQFFLYACKNYTDLYTKITQKIYKIYWIVSLDKKWFFHTDILADFYFWLSYIHCKKGLQKIW